MMTWEQAAENRRKCYEYLSECKNATPENVEANRLAIEALERMIPEQLKFSDRYQTQDGVSVSGRCPICGTGVQWSCAESPKVIFCHRCGKALHE